MRGDFIQSLKSPPPSCVLSTYRNVRLLGCEDRLLKYTVDQCHPILIPFTFMLGVPYPLPSFPCCWSLLTSSLFTVFKLSMWPTDPYRTVRRYGPATLFSPQPAVALATSSRYSSNSSATNLLLCVSICRILPSRLVCCLCRLKTDIAAVGRAVRLPCHGACVPDTPCGESEFLLFHFVMF